MIAGYY
jgi:hypothetical protein